MKQGYWEEMCSEMIRYPAHLMRGGWPYTEHWNTDIANVAFLEDVKPGGSGRDCVCAWTPGRFERLRETAASLVPAAARFARPSPKFSGVSRYGST